jgi:hypothetical protein
MCGDAQPEVCFNDEAAEIFESRRPRLLFTRFCSEKTELPTGRDGERIGFVKGTQLDWRTLAFAKILVVATIGVVSSYTRQSNGRILSSSCQSIF